MFSKKSNFLKIPYTKPGDPSEIKDVSSAYWESLYSSSPNLIPLMSLLFLIDIPRISAHKRNRQGDIGSPCLFGNIYYLNFFNFIISWNFIHSTLDFFNFGFSIKQWIYTFYNGIKSCVFQNGISSDYIYPQRGCRQGDPISHYLFLLCAEILEISIKNNKDITGIRLGDEEYKLSQYAADTSLI